MTSHQYMYWQMKGDSDFEDDVCYECQDLLDHHLQCEHCQQQFDSIDSLRAHNATQALGDLSCVCCYCKTFIPIEQKCSPLFCRSVYIENGMVCPACKVAYETV